MTQVFISYSRKDAAFAKKLTASFETRKVDAWIDWIDIPPGADWWDQIQKGIQEADSFIFLLSPDSVKSEVCGKEIAHAVQNGKRLIPVIARDVSPNDAPPVLAKLNWIFCREEKDDFEEAFGKLLQAVHTDLEWTQVHRRLQVRALEWDKENKESSFLLRGKDLQEAEQQLAVNSSKDPLPTDLQREYVLNSRQLSDRQRRRNTTLAIAAVIVFAILAAFGFNRAVEATNQANIALTNEARAKEQAQIASGREIAAYAVAAREPNFNLSLLLGVEAFGISNNIQTRTELLKNALKNPELHQFLMGHTAAVNSVAFSPDGKILATGSGDKTVILWDMATGRPIGSPLSGHHGWIRSVAFSPDGRTLASGGDRGEDDPTLGEIILWNVESKRPIGDAIIDNVDAVYSLAFSPDNKLIASGGYSGLTLWDVETHQPSGRQFPGPIQAVNSLAFSPDGATLASGGMSDYDFSITLWDVAKREKRAALPGHTGITGYLPYLTCLAFDPQGRFLASGSVDRTIMLWDMQTLKAIGEPLLGHAGDITSLAISADGNTLASASNDKTIILWDLSSGYGAVQNKTLSGHGGEVTSVAFNPVDGTLISGGNDAAVIVWGEPESPISNQKLRGSKSAAFSPDGKILASADCETYDAEQNCMQGKINLWDMTSQMPGEPLIGHSGRVVSVAFNPVGRILASGSEDATIILWDMGTGKPVDAPLSGHTGSVKRLAFSPDGKTLASLSGNEFILWDVESRKPLGAPLKGHESNLTSIAFSIDGNMLATGSSDSTVIFWDAKKLQAIGSPLIGDGGIVQDLSFSPDGKYLFSSDGEVWDINTRQPIGTSFGINGISMAFSPDGGMIADGGDADGALKLWDVASRQQITQFTLEQYSEPESMAFSPDGSALAEAGSDDLFLWNLDPKSWIEKTCQRVGRNFTQAEWRQYFTDTAYRVTCSGWPEGK